MSKSKLWAHGENFNFWKKKFPDLKFSGIVPSNIIYHFWEFYKYLGSKNLPKKFQSAEKSTNQFFYKHSRFFFEKRALSGVIIYQYLTSDQKLEKSSDGKYHNSWMLPSRNLQTTYLFACIAQPSVENTSHYTGYILNTRSFIDMRFLQDDSWGCVLSFSSAPTFVQFVSLIIHKLRNIFENPKVPKTAPKNLVKFGKIFPGSESFRDNYSQYFLPILRFSDWSGVKKIFFKISKCQNPNYGQF